MQAEPLAGQARDFLQGAWLFEQVAGTGHDGEFGRDAAKRRDRDGRAGFSFEKVGPGGETLPNSAPVWSCVRDLVTGAMWEVKTSDGGPRDASHLFTNQGNGQANDASGYDEPFEIHGTEPVLGRGYAHEVAEVDRCVRAGL